MLKSLKIICMFFVITICMKTNVNAMNRIIYDINPKSLNEFKITLKWQGEDNGNIQIMAADKQDDGTICVHYKAYSKFNVRNITVDTKILNMDLKSLRKPNVVLKNDLGNMNMVSDLPDDKETKEAISNLYMMGIINGYDDGTFKPDNYISKEEFSSIFAKMMKYKIEEEIESTFKDLPNDRWSKSLIMSLTKAGIIKGQDDGSFGVMKNVTTGEVATMLDRARELESPSYESNIYKHQDTMHWANESITDLLSAGYIKKDDKFYIGFNQDKPLTRGEVALILNRD